MEKYRQKVKDLAAMKREIDQLKAEGKKVVFTNGCFDLLHPGHARYLWTARQSGDYLVVAVNSDRSVKAIKAKVETDRSRAGESGNGGSLGVRRWCCDLR